ncbi:hypothetical protein H9660_14610 [Clostridium sp. Sa3CUN1]|uniref:Uncharacterized protein n=1 Tax=Clostridium gallinarum TaxID=2762246 RepID=A0ABR8Q7G8_9CLOT|nr:hypothetical protein [Clostridium gallinarum]MBD7916376.1 hypothetical protein [Clostridium gallinarum]
MKKLSLLALSILGVIIINTSVALACDPTTPDRPFYGYTIYPNLANNYTPYQTKQTGNTHSYSKVTKLSNISSVDLWIDSAGQITPLYTLSPSSYFTPMYYYSNYGVGTSVRVGMENTYNSSVTGYVDGVVDYE